MMILPRTKPVLHVVVSDERHEHLVDGPQGIEDLGREVVRRLACLLIAVDGGRYAVFNGRSQLNEDPPR